MRSHITVIALLFAPTMASAGVVISIENTSVPYSAITQMGSFEVFVTSDLATPPDLFATQIRLSISPSASGVKFMGVATPTSHPYVFSSLSTPSGAPVTGSGGAMVDGRDYLLTGVAPLMDGQGLLKVDYQVLGGTPVGSFNIIVSTNPAESFLTMAAGNGPGVNIPFTTKNGRINIVSIVPEPSTLAMIPAVILGAGYYFWRQRLRPRRTNSAGL